MLLFESVCLAGVVGSGCCWLSHVRHNKCLTVLVFCFASGCTECFRCYYGVIPVVVRVDPWGYSGWRSVIFSLVSFMRIGNRFVCVVSGVLSDLLLLFQSMCSSLLFFHSFVWFSFLIFVDG